MLRLFAALDLPAAVKDRLVALQRGLDGRLTTPEQMHLTLAFFGEQSEPVAQDLHDALGAITAPGFTLWLDGVGTFGGAKPTIFNAAVRPEPALDHLEAKVRQAAQRAGLGLPAARYTPHVALARFGPEQITAEKGRAAHRGARRLPCRAGSGGGVHAPSLRPRTGRRQLVRHEQQPSL
jgi:2'-5' RNA ligase